MGPGWGSVLWEVPTSSVQTCGWTELWEPSPALAPGTRPKSVSSCSPSPVPEGTGQVRVTRKSPGCSVGPPHSLIHAARRAQGCGRVAVAAVGFHAISLTQAGVHEVARGHRGAAGAGGQHAGGRALTTARSCHGELVGAGGGAVEEVVGRRVGLEGPALALRGTGVGRREVGVVEAAAGGHARYAQAAQAGARRRGAVREGGRHGARVVHPGVREAALREALQRREGAVKLAGVREGVQV